jgi:metallo-beta-lactamase family protein
MKFVREMDQSPKEIRLVHGDYQPKRTLAEKLTGEGYRVI